MTRKTAADFEPAVLQTFDLYVHGDIDRRGFIDRVARLGLGVAGATSTLEALRPQFAEAEQVKTDDPRIVGRAAEFPSPDGNGVVKGYLVKPAKASGKLPLILVIHENRGLNPHIEDIARRLALADFIAFAPDGLAPLGGYPGDEDKARELFQKLDQEKLRKDFLAAAVALKALPDGNGKVGVVGFCYGGGIANFLATRVPDLGAAVPFYGAQPKAEDVRNIKAPLLIHYAGVDDRINGGWPAYEAALKEAKISYQAFVYPNVQHGFNNDTTPRYDETAAKLAWGRTVDFFNAHLRS
ncbi:dienelactone hydrolase family protein [Methylocystis parvus]|uniref:Dienelactone hydrolase family protein n=1 Tax=Methylocystis parvus TaxID=134 RepID=A0A6B8M1V2_9HYPH|nr:dienelactone hydrolase family protein [Methylocystis parvus]QGM97784.1 dienelactone hydrolase family protein [Methylocystis parvus]WBK01911.1 dienelactone hydrolase family protein [Methylocystis parvus OBBP]